MDDRERRENAAEVYEAVLADVSRFCSEHGTELVEAGGPIHVVVETEHELAADSGFRANIADALAQIVRINLGTAHVAADVVGRDGLSGKGYRLRLPGPAAPPRRSRFTQPTTTPVGPPGFPDPDNTSPPPARIAPPLVTSDAPDDSLVSLPPIPHVGPDPATRALSGHRTIRFSYGAAPSSPALSSQTPSWLFTLRPAPVWVPLGRGLGDAGEGTPVMELSLLRSIPGGRLLFLCYWQGRTHLLRSGARPDYLIALDTLDLTTDDVVPLPRSGVLRWRHRTKPGVSVLQYTISAEEAR
ncbi:hypothetical protein [Cryptosporangium aurantiacum]|uniref:Uncharacterized protein n=1 Tax=Cryptosporangium aurantiacum TaxID=134849 RepID=A0A1M7RIE2_9ACTN|nr:hypothetical protein [Cryptosporangium aurantiacum]SHN45828.1 hypothetical protein SAMN05443668_11321 [Cryptosporangium aurantiacum]